MKFRLLVTLVAVLALAACGDDGGDEVQAGGDATAPSTTLDPETPVSSPSTTAGDDTTTTSTPGTTWARIEPTEDLVDPVVATPDQIVPDPEDPNAVLVRFYGGVQECYGARAAVFGEDDTVVRILLETGRLPEATGPCIEIAEAQELQVVLDGPVGDRRLLAADSADEGEVVD